MLDFTTRTTAPVSLFRSAGVGRVESVMGAAHIYKARSAETGGRFSCFEMLVPPGAMVPRHQHHDEDEAFFCLDGELVLEMEGMLEDVHLGVGDFCFSPRGRWHSFRNERTVPARVLCFVTPGDKIERMFNELETVTEGAVPAMAQLFAIVKRHGVSPVMEDA